MTLRILLVGLVASMGLELPGNAEVEAWTRSGRAWVQAVRADVSVAVVRADRPGEGPTDCRQAGVQAVRADVSVAVVRADRPGEGPTDCRQADEPAPTESPVTVEAAEAPGDAALLAASEAMAAEFTADSMTMRGERPPVDDAPAMLASEPLLAVGLPGGEEPADVVESSEMPGEAATTAEEVPTRAERVGSALRLTGEAVRAWSELLAEEAGPTR